MHLLQGSFEYVGDMSGARFAQFMRQTVDSYLYGPQYGLQAFQDTFAGLQFQDTCRSKLEGLVVVHAKAGPS